MSHFSRFFLSFRTVLLTHDNFPTRPESIISCTSRIHAGLTVTFTTSRSLDCSSITRNSKTLPIRWPENICIPPALNLKIHCFHRFVNQTHHQLTSFRHRIFLARASHKALIESPPPRCSARIKIPLWFINYISPLLLFSFTMLFNTFLVRDTERSRQS